jgi:hypothetical protein
VLRPSFNTILLTRFPSLFEISHHFQVLGTWASRTSKYFSCANICPLLNLEGCATETEYKKVLGYDQLEQRIYSALKVTPTDAGNTDVLGNRVSLFDIVLPWILNWLQQIINGSSER